MRKALSVIAAGLAVLPAVAASIGPGGTWTVVCPSGISKGVDAGLAQVAGTLADVLSEGVGAKVSVGTDSGTRAGGRLFLGEAFAKKAGLMKEPYAGLANSIAEKNGDIYLFGRDRAGANADAWEGCVIPSALAAVRFMEKFAGAAFLMPGKTGTEVPKRERITVPNGYRDRDAPKYPFGAGRYPGGISYCYANGIFGYGACHTYGGHTYPAACPRQTYFKDHPEYFALIGGKRAWGSSDGCQAYCISNPEFQKMLYAELLRRYDAGAEVCQLGQHDGNYVCECAECEKMYGTGKDWGEKLWLFHKSIAERLLKDRPGKLVQIMSYAKTSDPPKSFKSFPANVIVEICRYRENDLKRWKDYAVPNGFSYYLYNWGEYPIPGITAKKSFLGLVTQVRRLQDYGMRGVYRCGYGELFGMEGPAYHVFNRFLQNPSLDIGMVVDRYCRLAFGPAADAMKGFYEELDKPLRAVDLMDETRSESSEADLSKYAKAMPKDPIDLLAFIYTAERIATMEDFLIRAEHVKGLTDKQKKRLALVRREFTYAKLMGEVAALYAAYRMRPSKPLFAPLAAAIRRRAAFIESQYAGVRMKGMDGWPEVQPFGNVHKDMFMTNGRLGATLDEPISWDLDRLGRDGIVPGERMTPAERKAEIAAKGLKPIVGWKPLGGVLPPGAAFKAYADGTGFSFTPGTNDDMRVDATVGAKDGLEPGKTYRITWITRYRTVNPARWWDGYYFTAEYDYHPGFVSDPPNRPLGRFLKGSGDWMKRTAIMTMCNRKEFKSAFEFRIYRSPGGAAEVAYVTLEEIKGK